MQTVQFPESAATSLIDGYCGDFVSLAASLAQTLEQVSMRNIDIAKSREGLERTERGMRNLAAAINELLQRCGQPGGTAGAPPARTATEPAVPVAAPRPRAAAPTAAPAPPAAAAPESIALGGTTQTMPLLPVVQFLGRMRKTGSLRVKIGSETMSFEIVTGCVHTSSSSHLAPDERLGHILVELGFVSAERIAETGKVDRRKLAAMLIKAGHVTDEQVMEAYERQIYKRLHRACKSPDASYEFAEAARAGGDGPLRITPTSGS